MRRLIESTFVTLGGDIGAPQVWGLPYLNCPEGDALNRDLLFGADALVLGRKTYEGLSAGYTRMAAGEPERPAPVRGCRLGGPGADRQHDPEYRRGRADLCSAAKPMTTRIG